MAKSENLPFPIGTTYFDGQTADTTTFTATNLEGKEYYVEDLFYVPSPFSATKTLRTAYLKRVRIVRNVATVGLEGGYLVEPQQSGTDGRYYLGRVNGYSTVGNTGATNNPSYGLDEFLPAAGVAVNDLAYVTIEGPFLGNLSLTAGEVLGTGNSIAAATPVSVGDLLIAATAAASTFATTQVSTMTCGRLAGLSLGTTGTTLGLNIIARLGRALSAVTTNQTTGVPLLMYFTHL
jgi:hypothetical protein